MWILLLICFYLYIILILLSSSFLFFFNDTATTEIYTLSLHDALPISFLQPKTLDGVVYQLSRGARRDSWRSEEHTSELQSRFDLVCRLLLEKKKKKKKLYNTFKKISKTK